MGAGEKEGSQAKGAAEAILPGDVKVPSHQDKWKAASPPRSLRQVTERKVTYYPC